MLEHNSAGAANVEAAGGTPAVQTAGGDACASTVPPWQKISGLLPGAEEKMSRSERRAALRKLFKHYEQLAREALAEHAAESGAEKEERTFLWDPLPALCFELRIARRKLSALTKELTGMAAHEVIDKIRAEKIEAKLSADVDAFCLACRIPPGNPDFRDDLVTRENWQAHIWKKLKRSRALPSFDRENHAIEMGFPNYARYRRGVMLSHGGQTPKQLEWDLLGGIGEFYAAAATLKERYKSFSGRNYQWIESHLGQPLDDAWARIMRERPEWIAQMKARLGFFEKIAPLAELTVVCPPPDEKERRVYEREVEIVREGRRRLEEIAMQKAAEERKSLERNAAQAAKFEARMKQEAEFQARMKKEEAEHEARERAKKSGGPGSANPFQMS
jgi:hypothetical protein